MSAIEMTAGSKLVGKRPQLFSIKTSKKQAPIITSLPILRHRPTCGLPVTS